MKDIIAVVCVKFAFSVTTSLVVEQRRSTNSANNILQLLLYLAARSLEEVELISTGVQV